jgi:hypothetical protein
MQHKQERRRLLAEKPEGKRPLRRPRRRQMDNMKTGANLTDLTQDTDQQRAVVNTVMNLLVP